MESKSMLLGLRSEASRLYGALGQFGNWWQRELLGILPPRVRDKLQRRGQYLLAEINDGHCTLRFGPRGNLDQIAHFETAEELTVSADFTHQIAGISSKADEVILLLPPELLLVKSLSLPIATEKNLANVLKFEMDRYTPFAADQVYYGYQVTDRDIPAQRITVALQLITHAKLDPLLAQLRAIDINPSVVAPAAEASSDLYSVNLLSNELQSISGNRQQQKRRRWQSGLLITVLVVTVMIPILRQEARIEVLQAEVEGPKALAEQAQALNEQITELVESRQFLVKKKHDAPSVLMILAELTQLIPDNTWLNRFELQSGVLKLQGESGEASSLISILEASEHLRNARFSSPVTTNPRTQKERFVIVAQLRAKEAP